MWWGGNNSVIGGYRGGSCGSGVGCEGVSVGGAEDWGGGGDGGRGDVGVNVDVEVKV